MSGRLNLPPSALFIFWWFLAPAHARIVVQNLSDSDPGSLREAIANAVDNEVITFDPALSGGTISLTSGHLYIVNDLTIDGSTLPRAIKIDPARTSRIFRISTGTAVTLNTLELANGEDRGGGAILNKGPLTLLNCTLHHNIAGGTSGTEDGHGGAIYSIADLSLSNCTISHNVAKKNGGAIHMESGIADLVHCTITLNSARPVNPVSTFKTFFIGGLGGGPVRQFTANTEKRYKLRNCIVSGNLGSAIPNDFPNQDIAPEALIKVPGAANLIDGVPLLGPLGNYGGPIPTMMPVSSSPAIDGGIDEELTTDQRGAARRSGADVDLGAVESGSLPVFDIVALSDPVVTLETDRDNYSGLPGGISLREAIVRAEPDSVITFAPSLSGKKIALTSGQLDLRKNVRIDGTSLVAPISISGSNQSRVFYIAENATASLRGLTICDGFMEPVVLDNEVTDFDGGGILNDGNLTIFRCLLKQNSAHSGGGLKSRRGGSIHIDQCTLDSNKAGTDGGGADLFGRFILENSTIIGNIASQHETGFGGGINLNGENPLGPEVSNCTFVENSATNGGGIACNTQTIRNCTIVGNTASSNSGGISVHSQNGAFQLHSSIIFGNQAPESPEISLPFFIDSTANLIGINPRLGPLQNNGGPTLTMMPLPSSPAIDPIAGSPMIAHETDQRGYFRTVGPTSDIGAVEAASFTFPDRLDAPVVTNSRDIFRQSSTPNPGDMTLREAIAYSAPGATITFSPTVSQAGIVFTEGEIRLHHPLSIDGSGPRAPIQFDAKSQSRFFNVPIERKLTLRNIQFKNGKITKRLDHLHPSRDEILDAELAGGAIFARGELEIDHCRFFNCRSNFHGGAIGSSADLSIDNSTFTECLAIVSGGAIWGYSEEALQIDIRTSKFESNRTGSFESMDSPENGGAIYLDARNSDLVIGSCYFLRNQGQSGGALFATTLTCEITGTTFFRNQSFFGFAMVVNNPTSQIPGTLGFRLRNSTFAANQSRLANSFSSPIILGNSGAEITHCTLADGVGSYAFSDFPAGLPVLTNCIVYEISPATASSFDPASSGNYIGPNPRLSPLGNHGGLWPTLVPMEGSPALEIGSITDLTTDQRGLPRISGVNPDAGAVERQTSGGELAGMIDPIVTRSDDPDFWNGNTSDLSLRQATNLSTPGSRITFALDLSDLTIRLEQGPLRVARSTMIDASGQPSPVSLVNPLGSEILEVFPEGSLSLTNFQFSGNSFLSTSAMVIGGEINLDRCRFSSNSGTRPLIQVTGSLKAADCHFSRNRCTSAAGVVSLFPGSTGTFQRCSFIENVGRDGGAILAIPSPQNNGTLSILTSTFQGNSAGFGGAISTSIPTTITHSTISGNSAMSEGGGVRSLNANLVISNSIIALNVSPVEAQISSPEPVTGTNFLSGDPLLSPPGFYGGPTMTMPPLPGSPVIDAGLNPTETLDQRGLPRIFGASVDLGAVEFQGEEAEFLLTFDLDSDSDGVSNGVETAIGRNPFLAQNFSQFDFKILPDGRISTGFDQNSSDSIIFKITRSSDLQNFETLILGNEDAALTPEDGLLLFEDPDPLPKSFYRIEVSPR